MKPVIPAFSSASFDRSSTRVFFFILELKVWVCFSLQALSLSRACPNRVKGRGFRAQWIIDGAAAAQSRRDECVCLGDRPPDAVPGASLIVAWPHRWPSPRVSFKPTALLCCGKRPRISDTQVHCVQCCRVHRWPSLLFFDFFKSPSTYATLSSQFSYLGHYCVYQLSAVFFSWRFSFFKKRWEKKTRKKIIIFFMIWVAHEPTTGIINLEERKIKNL